MKIELSIISGMQFKAVLRDIYKCTYIKQESSKINNLRFLCRKWKKTSKLILKEADKKKQ